MPFRYFYRKIFNDREGNNKNKKKKKNKGEGEGNRGKPAYRVGFEENSSFNATRFIDESFNRTEFIISWAKVCGNRKAPNTQMGFVGRFPVGNPKVSGFKF